MKKKELTNNSALDTQKLTNIWARQWLRLPPIPEQLRSGYPDRWVRFHTLPKSKRYPENEEEYRIAVDRYNALLKELKPGQSIFLITSEWTKNPAHEVKYSFGDLGPALHSRYWQTVNETFGNTVHLKRRHVYIAAVVWPSELMNEVLRAVADDKISGVIIAPGNLGWLYHPYDGGVDIVLETSARRDELWRQYKDWTSSHSEGF